MSGHGRPWPAGFLLGRTRPAMLEAMLRGLPSPSVRPVVVLAVAVLAACRLAPAEAPPPDAAAAWPGDDPPLEPGDDPMPVAAASPEAPEAARTMAAPVRPRPPRTIFQDELRRATGPGPSYLLRQLGPEPFRYEGRFVGWEITQLYPDDPELCGQGCDLAVGDVVLGVNGHRLQTPQELSDVLAALPSWTQLRVQSLRGGQRRDVTYAIAPDPAQAPG